MTADERESLIQAMRNASTDHGWVLAFREADELVSAILTHYEASAPTNPCPRCHTAAPGCPGVNATHRGEG